MLFFQEADTDKSGGLDLKEFSALFKELATRPEIVSLFTKYASSRDFMTVEDLRNFMIGEQHAAPSVQMCEGFIETYEPIEEVKSRKQMSVDGAFPILCLINHSIVLFCSALCYICL